MSGRAKWVLGAISIAALAAPPAPVAATFPGENGKIAFVSGRDGGDANADVYVLDFPGDATPTGITNATGALGQHRHPTWSPRLDAIAYARWESPTNQKIFIDFLDVGGIPQLRLGPHDSSVRDDRPNWSPNGKQIAYESEITDGSNQQDIMVATINENGGNVSSFNLTDSGTLFEGKPVWSNDGKWIYYSRRASMAAGDDDIYRERADGSGTPQVVAQGAVAEYQPALSPRNDAMCFTRGPFGSTDADVFTLAPVVLGGTQTDLSDSSVGAYNCVYSPQGERIAYVNGIFGNGALLQKNANDTGTATELTPNVEMVFDGNPDWAPKRPAFCQGKPARIAGTDQPDDLRGTSRKDVIQGHADRDEIDARKGKDRLCGAGGNDTLKGGKDNDKLFGAAGDDTLIGGKGRDLCEGGGGDDNLIGCEKK